MQAVKTYVLWHGLDGMTGVDRAGHTLAFPLPFFSRGSDEILVPSYIIYYCSFEIFIKKITHRTGYLQQNNRSSIRSNLILILYSPRQVASTTNLSLD